MDERMDAAMSDMDLVPLLIQENYLNYCPSKVGRDDSGTARLDAIARTALSIAEGDIVNVQIRRFRQWQHAQMGAFMTSIIPYVHHNLPACITFLHVHVMKLDFIKGFSST